MHFYVLIVNSKKANNSLNPLKVGNSFYYISIGCIFFVMPTTETTAFLKHRE